MHALCLAALSGSISPLIAQTNTGALSPRLYLSNADVTRLRQQAGNPALAAAYADLETKTRESVDAWLKKYPATPAPRSTGELIALGKLDNPSPDFRTIAAAYALHPTPVLGSVLREKLMAAIGVRQINNYWFNDGIHEGEASMQFLEAYDLASGAGLMTSEDKQVVKEELRRCAHFLQGWMLDSWWPDERFSQGYTWYYRSVYCLNFHIFATSMMGTIAMLYPDLPESAEWLRAAQSELPKLLFTEFGLDGGYGGGLASLLEPVRLTHCCNSWWPAATWACVITSPIPR